MREPAAAAVKLGFQEKTKDFEHFPQLSHSRRLG